MTYLKKYGWINFRMRAMLMSFASYNLWQPWQQTSPLLANTFTDYEPGIHICQVQMQSGVTGINLPRIYSVTKQSLDQDPEANWIKNQLPQLEDIDKNIIHSAELGELYKEKVVDLKSSAKKARELVWQIRSNSEFRKKAREIYELHGSRKSR
jgi:deoxyribodipyrimidine photo-lyase